MQKLAVDACGGLFLWFPGDSQGIDAPDTEMTGDPWRHIQPELRYTGGNGAEAFLQFGACQRLADAPMRAIAENRMQPRLVGAMDIEHVRTIVGLLVTHCRHGR
jgi:hypothetical protein